MKQINELSETIDNFRNFFRADTEAEPFELNKSVTQTLALLEAEMDNHRIDIEFQRPDTPVIVRGYPTQLRQALLNLLINAKDAIVLNNAEPGRIRIRLHTEESRTLLTICDNGGGIPESIMGRIFDPFFSTKEAGKGVGVISGSGVGLYMTKLIIEENFKGRIEVLNAREGACFTLILPMAQ